MSIIVQANIIFSIPVDHLPPDIAGENATPESDAVLPVSGAEQIAYDLMAKLQPILPDGVYPILGAAIHFKMVPVGE